MGTILPGCAIIPASMVELTQARIGRKITAARLVLFWEGLWDALCWPVILALVLAATALSGLLTLLPDALRYGLLGFLAAAIIWSLRHVLRITWPSPYAAMRRIEARSSLFNRPLSTSNDKLAGEAMDDRSLALWEEHKRRQLAKLNDLKVGTPQSNWRDRDPRSLRVPASLALLAVLFLAQGDGASNLKNTFQVGPAIAQKPISLDAWLKPPAYTAKPPLLLTSPAQIEKLKADRNILIPGNSGLVLRLDGARNPRLAFYDLSKPDAELKDQKATIKSANGLFEAEAKLNTPTLIKVLDGNTELAAWHISLIPDKPPSISIVEEPKSESLGALTVKWKASDDYGVSAITSEIDLSDNQQDGVGFTSNGVFLFDAPKFPVSLRKSAPREEQGTTSADLTAHPWAGLFVDLTLEVTDAAKQATKSEVKTFKLPERFFTKPLAQALIEQRKTLIMDPGEARSVEKLLQALLIYPEGLIENSGTQIAIAAIVSRIQNVRDHSDVEEAVGLLWQAALSIEEGDLADARAELEAARKALERALAEGATPEQLQELMKNLRGAMDRYMQSMQKEAEKRQAQGQQNKNRQAPNGKVITQQDLQEMLDTIEKLTQNGANEAAQELLAQLDEILKNLEPGMAQQGGPPGDSATTEMLNELSELMRRQQELMDKTQRAQPGDEGDPLGQEGDDPGNRSGNQGTEGLAGEQGDLGRMLEQFMKQLGQNGLQSPPSFGEAGKQMGEAEQSLQQQEREQALGEQGEALNQLRAGAQDMARQIQQQGQSGQDNTGRDGQARGETHDPLGRPMPNSGDNFGPKENMLPSELAIRRAREILELLRSRANTPDLPRIDKDYIDRLLRGLY
ncbi:MAG: TIGR02302 family protein [Aestuariivirga sp.]